MLEGSAIYCDLKHLILIFPGDTLLILIISKLWAKVPSITPVPVFPEVPAHCPRASAGSWVTWSTKRIPGSIQNPLSERLSAQSWGEEEGCLISALCSVVWSLISAPLSLSFHEINKKTLNLSICSSQDGTEGQIQTAVMFANHHMFLFSADITITPGLLLQLKPALVSVASLSSICPMTSEEQGSAEVQGARMRRNVKKTPSCDQLRVRRGSLRRKSCCESVQQHSGVGLLQGQIPWSLSVSKMEFLMKQKCSALNLDALLMPLKAMEWLKSHSKLLLPSGQTWILEPVEKTWQVWVLSSLLLSLPILGGPSSGCCVFLSDTTHSC